MDACPTGAFTFGDEDDPAIKALIAKAEPLKPELATKPRVYYIGKPKKFIAGAVYDKEADECLERRQGHGDRRRDRRQAHGHHRQLRRLLASRTSKTARYTLLIEKSGYLAAKVGPVDVTKKDMNVGDIAMWKA